MSLHCFQQRLDRLVGLTPRAHLCRAVITSSHMAEAGGAALDMLTDSPDIPATPLEHPRANLQRGLATETGRVWCHRAPTAARDPHASSSGPRSSTTSRVLPPAAAQSTLGYPWARLSTIGGGTANGPRLCSVQRLSAAVSTTVGRHPAYQQAGNKLTLSRVDPSAICRRQSRLAHVVSVGREAWNASLSGARKQRRLIVLALLGRKRGDEG